MRPISPRLPRGVIFDMDGVLINSHPISCQLIREAAGRFGLTLDDEDMVLWEGLSSRDFWIRTRAKYHLPEDVEHYRNSYDFQREIELYQHLELAPGIRGALEEIRRHSMKIALASNGRRSRIDRVLTQFGLQDFFPVITTADDIENHKPHPEVFLKCADRMALAPRDCLVIEDSAAGIAAARAAGMKCVAYTGFSHQGQDVSGADARLGSFVDLSCATLSAIFD